MRVTDAQTDRRTDGRTDGRTDRILIARPRLHSMQRGKKRTIVSSFLQDIIPERDGQKEERTDRRNPSGYYSALHCEQCGRAVKIVCLEGCNAEQEFVHK